MICTHNILLRVTDIVGPLLFQPMYHCSWAQKGTHPVDMHMGSMYVGVFRQSQRAPRQDAMREEAHCTGGPQEQWVDELQTHLKYGQLAIHMHTHTFKFTQFKPIHYSRSERIHATKPTM